MMEFALSTLSCQNSTLKCQAKEAGSPLKLHHLISVITVDVIDHSGSCTVPAGAFLLLSRG